MKRKLSNQERETIILFNEADPMASIFTYSKPWQKHLENKLGLKPDLINDFGGRGYEIDKKRIKPPRAKKVLSPETKARLVKRMREVRSSGVLIA